MLGRYRQRTLPSASQYHYPPAVDNIQRHLTLGLRISIARIIFVGLVFLNIDLFIAVTETKSLSPWNLIAYFIQGVIQVINCIGYAESFRILRKQKLTLKLMEQGSELHGKKLKVCSKQGYLSEYSLILAYKITDKDTSIGFRLSKLMHVLFSFIFFGKMAFLQQQLYMNPHKYLLLWVFLLSAYIGSFQIDYYMLQKLNGPYLKFNKFHISKICEVYTLFRKWRNQFRCGLVVNMVLLVVCLVAMLRNMGLFTALSYLYMLCLALTLVLFLVNNSIMSKAEQNLQNFSYCSNSLVECSNLSLFGILAQSQENIHRYIFAVRRIVIVIILIFYDCSWPFSVNTITILSLLHVEWSKFIHGTQKIKINYMNEMKYEVIANKKQKQDHIMLEKQSQDELNTETGCNRTDNDKQIGSQCCSVCLLDYQADDDVIILDCQHVYHTSCLNDWMKQKKECPLCRSDLVGYFG